VLRNRVRLWSLGMQEGIEYDSGVLNSPPQLRHDCIEIFPAGGFIYITDEVFETKPQLALSIIKLFFAKIERLRSLDGAASLWHEVDDALVLWRLCVRPELMEHLMERCEQRAKDLDAGDPDMVALAQLYTLFSNTNYIEQDTPMEPLNNIPDKYPVLSERRIIAEEQPVDYFNTLAQSQEKANLHMIRYFAGLQIDMRRDYRHFFVVHTEPSAPCAKEWMSEIQTIADVITPEQCIVELEKDGSVSMFDFCERYMQKKDVKLASPVAPVVDSQCSIEEGEIRSQS
jgi:chromo domain-containing protein 1